MSSMIAQKCTPNQRNKNNLKDNHLIKTTAAHLTFGEYQNVFLTAKEYKRLKADFAGLDGLIEQLSAYIQSTGKKYADHATTLRIWAKRQKTERKSTPGIPLSFWNRKQARNNRFMRFSYVTGKDKGLHLHPCFHDHAD